jgi:glycerol transport system permease protein
MPRKGVWVSVCLVLMALPLLIPWNVVGAIWNIFALPDLGLLGRVLNGIGFNYNFTRDVASAWFTIILMDVWHWTSLVVLLAYAGLISIPDAYYQAARIDGASRWAVFRFIQLPKMKRVLTIAVLLRFMDSFMIYTEVFVVTGGGPGNSTTLLSIDLVKLAIGQFDLGTAAAMSIIYFLIVLLFLLRVPLAAGHEHALPLLVHRAPRGPVARITDTTGHWFANRNAIPCPRTYRPREREPASYNGPQ